MYVEILKMLNELPAHMLESLGCLVIICAYLPNIVIGSYCISRAFMNPELALGTKSSGIS